MKLLLSHFFTIILAFLGFAIISGLTGCNQTENTNHIAADLQNTELLPDQISNNLTINFIDSSFNKASIFADRGRIFSSENYSILDSNVKVIFYSITGRQNGVLTAKQVKIDDLTKNMFATGNVLVISDSTKSQLETEELEWNNSTHKLHSKVFVKITSPKEIINGWGFESDESLSNYKIFKVTGVISNE